MAQLCMYLPPFSPDYSGAGSILFDLNALTVMHDAGGCTGNYTGHDEPRWYGSTATVFCSALRMIDVIMGNDEKLKENVLEAVNTLKPELIALIGSPVPMVIGMDLKGLAHEIENESGIPTIGIETTGTDYYDIGIFKAAKALFEKMDSFYGKPVSDSSNKALSFNILGATPLDYEYSNDINSLQAFLEKEGYSCTMRLGYGYTISELRESRSSLVNLALSHSGYLVAKYMEERYGIPYICGFPFGKSAQDTYLKILREVINTKTSGFFFESPFTISRGKDDSDINVLFVGDQIIGESMKASLGAGYHVSVGCIFGVDKSLPSDSAIALPDEDAIQEAINDEAYDVVIADPIMKQLLSGDNKKVFVSFPQYTVSGDIHFKDAKSFLGVNLDNLIHSQLTQKAVI